MQKARVRRALIVAPVVAALSATTLVSAQASTDDGAAQEQARKGKGYNITSKHFGYRYVARWNPCAKIRYKINPRGSTKRSRRDVHKAIKRLSRVSGLKFKFTGRTKILPRPRAKRAYPGRTKLVIGWTKPRKRKVLKGNGAVAGMGWKVYRKKGKKRGIGYKGYVLRNKNIKYPKGFGKGPKRGYGTEGQLWMHELGHAVGLWHVKSKRQLMYKYTLRRKARWGPGDRRGLKRVGRPAGCLRPRVAPKAPTRIANDAHLHSAPAGAEHAHAAHGHEH